VYCYGAPVPVLHEVIAIGSVGTVILIEPALCHARVFTRVLVLGFPEEVQRAN